MKTKLLIGDKRIDSIYLIHSFDGMEMTQTSNIYKREQFVVLVDGNTLTSSYGSIEKGSKEIVSAQYQEALKLSSANKDISTYHPNPDKEIEFMAEYRKLLMERFDKLHK